MDPKVQFLRQPRMDKPNPGSRKQTHDLLWQLPVLLNTVNEIPLDLIRSDFRLGVIRLLRIRPDLLPRTEPLHIWSVALNAPFLTRHLSSLFTAGLLSPLTQVTNYVSSAILVQVCWVPWSPGRPGNCCMSCTFILSIHWWSTETDGCISHSLLVFQQNPI